MHRISRSPPWRRVAAVVLAITLASFAFALPAQASSGGSVGKHCVVRLEPIQAGETKSRTVWSHCYQTFREAIAAATNGRVNLRDDVRPGQVTQSMLNAGASPASVTSGGSVVGIDWNDGDYQGSSFTATVTYDFGCMNNHNYAITSMPGGFDNSISSNRPFTGCNRAVHWEETGYTGASRVCHLNITDDCKYIGNAMNDRTSSEEWFDT